MAPTLYHVESLRKELQNWPQANFNEMWVCARPLNPFFALRHRLTLAWRVFTGRYDALQWVETIRTPGEG